MHIDNSSDTSLSKCRFQTVRRVARDTRYILHLSVLSLALRRSTRGTDDSPWLYRNHSSAFNPLFHANGTHTEFLSDPCYFPALSYVRQVFTNVILRI